jgi:signal recognition particle subunit SRP14|tara:strand:+ start:1082 stop:1429 length:348 start_codon:yes stop_codon:yes gene_type:complete|mmetsp:Transcript_7209/g.32524  ORF Transcript_7209/g.32524 Transcript_7209/m.32524 type:complete len:116 (-) Transcript_7209:93-440(-)
MVLLENDQFLTELTKMYERNRESGSVWVTMKRSMMKRLPKRGERPSPEQVLNDPEWVRLIRASDGKKKISTTVETKAAEKFSRSLSLVQMASMDGLQELKKPSKKERKGSSKSRA